MSADTLIRAALDAGVELRFVDGRLRVTGKRKAVEAWAPRLRERKDELIEALSPDWRTLDQAYQRHHFSCRTCIAAGQGAGLRCGTGAALWSAYQSTPEKDTP